MSPLLLCRFAQTTASVLLAGTLTLTLLAWGTGVGRETRWRELAWVSWCVLVGSAVLQLWLTAAEMSGCPCAQALSGEVLGRVLEGTRFGAVWQVRAGLVAALFCVLRAGALRQPALRPRMIGLLALAGALLTAALLASLVWSGHAYATGARPWLLPIDVLHVVTAGAWPGGLLPLAMLLALARRRPELVPAAMTVTRRFSRLSLGAVGILALTGLLNALGLVGTVAALWPSAYGRLLLIKVALFVGMICLGALNRRLLRTAGPASVAETLPRLWRHVAGECALGALVLLATEALATTPPPAAFGLP